MTTADSATVPVEGGAPVGEDVGTHLLRASAQAGGGQETGLTREAAQRRGLQPMLSSPQS